jgi:pyruvate kinase
MATTKATPNSATVVRNPVGEADGSAGMEHTRRAKIVATLGPACSTPAVFRSLVRAGLDVARLNFSHGSHEQKGELIRMVRAVSREEKKPVCILADLQGPKIRTGKLKDGKPVQLVAGERLTITPQEIQGTAAKVGTTFKTLAENLERGSRILLSDGLIELRVDRIDGVDVVCEIVNGGALGENKGINLPGIPVKVPSLTEKDEEDLIFAIGAGVDAVAVSFVRTADDVRHVKRQAGCAEVGRVDHCEAGEAAGGGASGLDPGGG